MIQTIKHQKYIIDGGPRTGKTTLCNLLQEKGHIVIPEAARMIIEEEKLKERTLPDYKGILPWNDMEEFQHSVFRRQLELESIRYESDVYMDRAMPHVIAYSIRNNIPLDLKRVHQHIMDANYTKVFFLDRLTGYIRDNDRIEDEEEAIRTHDILYITYSKMGIDMERVPEGRKEERLEYILSRV